MFIRCSDFVLANYLNDVVYMIVSAFSATWTRLVNQLPQILVGVSIAVLFLIVGYIIALFAKIIVKKALNALKLDEWAAEHKLKDAVGGIELSSLAGSFVKWYIFLVFLVQATEFVGLKSVRTFMDALVYFAPLALSALIILTLGVLLSKFVRNKIEATHHKYRKTGGIIVEVLVIFVTLLVSLRTVGINVSVLENAFLLAVGAFFLILALIFGLSLGLAFKEDAKSFVDEMRKGMR